MGSCYSGDHTAEDHLHTDITWNFEEPQQKYRPSTVNNRLLGGEGGGGLKHEFLKTPESCQKCQFDYFLEFVHFHIFLFYYYYYYYYYYYSYYSLQNKNFAQNTVYTYDSNSIVKTALTFQFPVGDGVVR